ncbi:aminotransferase class IV family protein [Pseudonocardia sp. DLS-67]
MSSPVVHRNGRPATTEDLAPLAFAGYAHFTAAQVRGGRIRGLDLHLARLRTQSVELFGSALPDERVRTYLRSAVEASPADASLMAFVHQGVAEVGLDVLVRTGPPASGPEGPLALTAVEHERDLPAVKHVGEVAKTYLLRRAVAQGFDDAAFVDRKGRIGEATIWNLAFWDGDAVVWPEAEVLPGITMQILRRQLDGLDVPQQEKEITLADLPALSGAVVMNSWTPGVAVRRIGPVPVPGAPDFLALLHRAYAAEPLTAP